MERPEFDNIKDYEAIFIPEGIEPPAREIIEQPELKLYYDGFGIAGGTESKLCREDV